jgi:beta-fructofuranosidase
MEKFDTNAIHDRLAESYPMQHRWHNRFHLEMPFGLINDPNGLAWFDGAYHIFYQWNPLGCEHKHKSWAHTVTRDFIHYTLPELSMWPDDEHDKDGCYSGCGTVDNGALRVLYTCNRKDGDVRIPAQRFGTLQPDGTVKKEEIIIPDRPAGITGHFRDPYLFSRHGHRYIVLGAQRAENETGTVLIYEEQADGWHNRGEIQTRLGDFGYMWECPNLLQFGSYDVLMFCPQGLPERDFDRQNIYQSGYIAGHLSLDSMDMVQHTKFQELDHGFDFYAPQTFVHEGRHILLGWMGMPDKDDEYPTKEQGWMYSLTMPRELRLRQGHIYSRPVREMRDLRVLETAVEIEDTSVSKLVRPLFQGSEILLNIELGEARNVRLTLAFGLEQVTFTYDRDEQVMTIDRNGMHKGGRGIRRFKLFVDTQLSLELFVDRSAIEAFFQHGEEAASMLVFPEKNILPELRLTAADPLDGVTGTIWSLDSFKYQADC